MRVAVPPVGSAWIVGPAYDLLFFSTLWLLPLFVIAPIAMSGTGLGAAFFYVWIYHLLIRFPHFAAMFRVTYLRPEHRAHYRAHWGRYFAVPVGILLVYALPLLTAEGYRTLPGHLLATLAYIWGYQHIGMQNYGVLQLYRMRAGVREERAGSRFEKAIFYAIIVAVALDNHLVPTLAAFGVEGVAEAARRWVGPALAGTLGALAVAYFARARRGGGLTGPGLLYFGVSLVAMIQWPFYERLPEGSWFLVFNGHHSVAYLGLLFLMEWNRKSPEESMSLGNTLASYLRFFLPLVAFSLGLVLVIALYGTARVAAGYTEHGGSLEVLLGFFVVHYYVESLVWKFRDPHNQRTSLPLLRAPGRSG